ERTAESFQRRKLHRGQTERRIIGGKREGKSVLPLSDLLHGSPNRGDDLRMPRFLLRAEGVQVTRDGHISVARCCLCAFHLCHSADFSHWLSTSFASLSQQAEALIPRPSFPCRRYECHFPLSFDASCVLPAVEPEFPNRAE